jgi:4'-phosphopantetheinyl transferase
METLTSGEVHIWYLWPDKVTVPEVLEGHKRLLSEEELAGNAAFRFPEHRHLHLLTRAFVRRLLSRYADVNPSEWQFTRDSYGKPRVSGPFVPAGSFSISHTRGLIVCAFAESVVGIDAEFLRTSTDSLQIAEHFFSPTEYGDLSRLPESMKQYRFFEYWTLKESYVKARGLGMSLDLSKFAFHIAGQDIRISFEAGEQDPASWQFRLLRPSDSHIAAASVQCGPDAEVEWNVRDGTALMQ